MKDQSIHTANTKADFIDLKSAKNPVYQPMAGLLHANPDRSTPENEAKKSRTATPEISAIVPSNANAVQSMYGAKHNRSTSTENMHDPSAGTTPLKPVLNLEGTLRLVHTIHNLDQFEIEQKEEAEDTLSNYYQGCEIQITDDKRNKFSTKNPVIIRAVAQFVRELCTSRLAEIEAEITLPG